MYFVYNILITGAFVLLAPYYLVRGLRQGKYVRNLRDRLGYRFPPKLRESRGNSQDTIWLHAVSVGEVMAALPLAKALKERQPERRLVISTTTETGQAVARERMKFADAVIYFPLDLRGAVRRAFRVVRPGLIVIMETEIWPNFLRAARLADAPVIYANGRISDRSFHGFQRWAVAGFRQQVFSAGRLYLMQSDEDARRVRALGAPPERVAVTGNLKYDVTPAGESELLHWLRSEIERTGRGPVLVAGSVMAGEELPLLEAFALVAKRWPDALLIFAPRKPERFAEAAAIVERAGWPVVRRSVLQLSGESAEALRPVSGGRSPVFLLDSLGELAPLYQLADVAFVGGSLVPTGGHNPLEPAAFGKPVAFGPAMENFRDIAAELISACAAIQVKSGAELGAAWIDLLEDDARRSEIRKNALAVVERHRGATRATIEHLDALLATAQVAR
jgi:3-deoxy-D-manno-octulosonic-acid transferase